MNRTLCSLSCALVVLAAARPEHPVLAADGAAKSQPPSFDDALAAANASGKPLILDFGAEWCEPCKALEADLARPQGLAATAAVHLVRYDVDAQPGGALRDRFKVDSYPTLLAVDPEGKEVDRQTGYGEFSRVQTWLEQVPDKAISVEQAVARAQKHRENLELQLTAGRRLLGLRRSSEAVPLLTRASISKDDKLAARARWALGEARVEAVGLPLRRRTAETLAQQYPLTPEGLRAFRYLATVADPPSRLLSSVVARRLATAGNDADLLEGLLAYALRGGAVAAAVSVAERLEPLAGPVPRRQGLVAEAWHMNGQTERAVALAEKAVAAASGEVRGDLERDLERFRRGGKQPSPRLAAIGPDDYPPRADGRSLGPPPWVSVVPKLSRKVLQDCLPDEPLGDVQILVLAGKRKEDLRVVPAGALPAPLVRCIEKATASIDIPPEQSFTFNATLDPPWFARSLAAARETATKCLPPAEPGVRTEVTKAVLSTRDGGSRVIVPGGQPELERCLARAFWFVRPPRDTVRVLTLVRTPVKRPPPGGAVADGQRRPEGAP
jgi:thiol-disulfide isomerase/thioredoxin